MEIKNSQGLKSLAALIIGIVFAIVISEVVLQIMDFPHRPLSGWVHCKNTNPGQCNYLGFRGREIAYSDDDFVVVLLGDSEVNAVTFPFEQIPERRLEHFLKTYKSDVKVFTIAHTGYGQDQQYLALKKYFEKHRADLVLLMFTARNDLYNNIHPTSGANNAIKPTFWLEDNKLFGPTEEWLEPVGSRIKLALLWGAYIGKTPGELRNKIWEEKIIPPKSQISERTQYEINLTRKLFLKIKKIVEANNGHFIIFKEERNDYLETMNNYQDIHKELFRNFEFYKIPLMMVNYTVSEDDTHLNQQAINKLMKELSVIIREKYFKDK